MALEGTTLPTGIIIDGGTSTRRFVTLGLGLSQQLWEEATITETTEYVALTRAFAKATCDANAQPAAPDAGKYTWTYSESQRYVGGTGSYTVKRHYELKTYSQVVEE
jgi:hypothetical protein